MGNLGSIKKIIYIYKTKMSVRHVWRGVAGEGRGEGVSQMDMMECLGGHVVTEFSN